MSKDRPINRRSFFRQGLSELLRPLAQAAEPLEEVIRQISSIDQEVEAAARAQAARAAKGQTPPAPVVRAAPGVWHRPPGALPEQQFRDTCSKCGECVNVCPAQCIKIDPNGAKGAGVPYIDVDSMPCVLCDGLLCMHNCPTGALVPTPIGDIDMGTAVWHEETCLRTRGEDCTICVDQCPVGEMALVLRDGRIEVLEAGCTGCGVCQHRCPTSPKSITVIPRMTGGESGGAVARSRR
ncbi:MAG TPA: 4Fe-4S dicluster domain-containing protein [Tepidisphaeraceae bacterium]|nr:4Fe-4S dicluster domain-containing protein [Tepidisphaeraceae bacterium]